MKADADLSSINIENLSIEEIEDLLPQLEIALEEAESCKPIYEVVDERFSAVWESVREEYTSEFNESLSKQREEFMLKEGFKIVFNKALGEENTSLFFKDVDECVKKKDFSLNKRFYSKVKDPDLKEVAQVGFSVYRLNLGKKGKDFVNEPQAKRNITILRKSDSSLTQLVLKEFSEIGLLPS